MPSTLTPLPPDRSLMGRCTWSIRWLGRTTWRCRLTSLKWWFWRIGAGRWSCAPMWCPTCLSMTRFHLSASWCPLRASRERQGCCSSPTSWGGPTVCRPSLRGGSELSLEHEGEYTQVYRVDLILELTWATADHVFTLFMPGPQHNVLSGRAFVVFALYDWWHRVMNYMIFRSEKSIIHYSNEN